jgi:hypothetical protein
LSNATWFAGLWWGGLLTNRIPLSQLMKRNEQMYAMLSMAVSLFPTRIDDHVHSILREKYGERMLKMQVS